jgi:rsbT co-antagonist protein RsbR
MNTSDIDQIDNALALNILQQIPTPIMAVNREMSLIFLNKAGLKMIGKPWEEIKGMPCRDVLKSRHFGTDDCRMKQVIDEFKIQSTPGVGTRITAIKWMD